MRAQLPRRFARQYQQAEIKQTEQQHGVWDIMLEQADHDRAGLWCVAVPGFNAETLSVGKLYTVL